MKKLNKNVVVILLVILFCCCFVFKLHYHIISFIDRNAIYVFRNNGSSMCSQMVVQLCSNDRFTYYGTNGCVSGYTVIYHGRKYSIQEVLSKEILTPEQLNYALYKGNGAFVYSKSK